METSALVPRAGTQGQRGHLGKERVSRDREHPGIESTPGWRISRDRGVSRHRGHPEIERVSRQRGHPGIEGVSPDRAGTPGWRYPGIDRVSRDKGQPRTGIAARRTAGAPVTHMGNPLNTPAPPGGQWNRPLPRRCLAGERAGAYQFPLAGGEKGFPRSPSVAPL